MVVLVGERGREVREFLERDLGREGLARSVVVAATSDESALLRQRAAFLRTLLPDQELVLLDEPFGALDALTRSQMQEWLLGVWQSLGKTIVLITHDVEEAVLLSDRVYVLTSRPARVKQVLQVELPRPRPVEAVTEADFVRLKATLLASLKEEGTHF